MWHLLYDWIIYGYVCSIYFMEMVQVMKRFENREYICDTLTGVQYSEYDIRNGELVKLLNDMDDRANRNIEVCDKDRMFNEKVMSIMRKYGIDDLDKLDQVLFEQKVW